MQNSEIKEKSNLSISEKREIIDRIKKGLNNELIIDEFNKRNFTINNKIVDKIRGEIEPDDHPKANLKAKSAPKIADALMRILKPQGVIVVIECEHFCMSMRGVNKPESMTTTSVVRGTLEEPALRHEALTLITHKA